MASYRTTLLMILVVSVVLIIGMCVFTAIEENSYEESFSLSIQIITTIGYGNIPPKTAGGKIFCILYMLVGIPANIVLLQKIGEHMLTLQKNMIRKIEMALFKREPQFLAEKCFVLCFLFSWLVIFIAAGVQMHEEGWSFLDGVYCFLVTFSTVGFGDIIPGVGQSTNRLAAIIVWSFYTFLGLCAISNVLNSVVDCIQSQQIRKLLKQRKAAVGNDLEQPGQG